jgi:16S rRNA (adenine1518-N6/adenine1519-N6)-dimethyltransferase
LTEPDAAAPEPSTRQTLTYLRQLFESRGIRPKNKLGQNFLIDLNLLDFLVRAAELGPDAGMIGAAALADLELSERESRQWPDG